METTQGQKQEATDNGAAKPLDLPRCEYPIAQFSPEHKMYWLGFPLDKLAPLDILLLLDRCKIDIISAHKEIAVLKARMGLNQKSAFQNMKNFLIRNKKI